MSQLKQLLNHLRPEPGPEPEEAQEPGGDDYFRPPAERLQPTPEQIRTYCARERAAWRQAGRFRPGEAWPINRAPRRR